jgi:hypothetical protein
MTQSNMTNHVIFKNDTEFWTWNWGVFSVFFFGVEEQSLTHQYPDWVRGFVGYDHMVVGFASTYIMSAYHH